MKRRFLILNTSVFLFVLLFAGHCGSFTLPLVTTTIDPDPLELHGGEVEYTVTVQFPPKSLHKGYVYNVKSLYVSRSVFKNDPKGPQEKEVEIGTVSFKSEDFDKKKRKDGKPENLEVSKTFSFPYTPNREIGDSYTSAITRSGELHAEVSAVEESSGKLKRQAERIALAKGVITTSELAQPVYSPAYVFHGYNDQEELIPNEVSFFFQQGSSKLTRVERARKEIKEFETFVASRNLTRSVLITGSHSPEGGKAVNTALAPARARAVEAYYRRKLRKYNYDKTDVKKIKFEKDAILRDYTPLRELLLSSKILPLSNEQRTQVLQILNGGGTFEDKEKALQKLPYYHKFYRKLYPKLRTSKTVALTVKKKRPNAEIIALAKQIVDGSLSGTALSHEELLYAATKTPLVAEKVKAYEAAVNQEDSWRAQNNLAAALLDRVINEKWEAYRTFPVDNEVRADFLKHVEEIENRLKEAQIKLGPDQPSQGGAEVLYNLALIHQLRGGDEYEAAAHKLLIEAKEKENLYPQTRQRVHASLGFLNIRKGAYQDAIDLLKTLDSGESRYNLGLAHLLDGNAQEATTILEDVVKNVPSKDATPSLTLAYVRANYALAIALARQGVQGEAILAPLRVTKRFSPFLDRRFARDLEFRNYRGITYQDILQDNPSDTAGTK